MAAGPRAPESALIFVGRLGIGHSDRKTQGRAFELDRRGARDMFRRLIWLAVLVGCAALAGQAGPGLLGVGGPVLLGVIGLVALTGFWWFTMRFLLAGRVSWKPLFPAAVATAVCWEGMEAVFSVIFSGMVTPTTRRTG